MFLGMRKANNFLNKNKDTTFAAYGADIVGNGFFCGISHRKRNALMFVALALLWLVVDILTKRWFVAHCTNTASDSFFGLIRFRLVHNTGAAWGILGDSTFALGVLSLTVCVIFTVYIIALAPKASLAEVLGVALVVGGGIGNAIDRFTLGYVIDFIEPVFIDFPVFNIADIGITCGFVIFLLSLLLGGSNDRHPIGRDAVSGAVGHKREEQPTPGKGANVR